MSSILEVTDLHVQYDHAPVLRGIDLRLERGELAGLVGPNGSGKSTLIRAITGTQDCLRGRVRIAGIDVHADPLNARRSLGFAVDPERLPRLLSGRQCIELIAGLRGAGAQLATSWSLSERLGLAGWLDHPVYSYSLGTRQKLAIVQALLGRPALILLDEVLNGLDPLSAYELKLELRDRAHAGAAVLLATHGLEVAERFLDRAVLLIEGRISADWSSADLSRFRADPEGGLEHAVATRMRPG